MAEGKYSQLTRVHTSAVNSNVLLRGVIFSGGVRCKSDPVTALIPHELIRYGRKHTIRTAVAQII